MIKLVALTNGTVSLGQKITFHNYSPRISFLSEKDKKNVIW